MEMSGQLHTPAALSPEPVWTWWWGEKFLAPTMTGTPNQLYQSKIGLEILRNAYVGCNGKYWGVGEWRGPFQGTKVAFSGDTNKTTNASFRIASDRTGCH